MVDVNNVSAFTICVLLSIRENSHLELSFVDDIKAVTHRTLLDDPGTCLDVYRFHTRVDHLALFVVDIAEHQRGLDGFRDPLLFLFRLFGGELAPVKGGVFFRDKSHRLAHFLELGNFLGLFLRYLLTNGFETFGSQIDIVDRVVVFILLLVLISGSMFALPGTFEEYLGVMLAEILLEGSRFPSCQSDCAGAET